MHCERFRATLDAYLDDSLPEAEWRAFREHLGECKSCLDLALEREPSFLIVAAPRPPAEPAQVEACVQSVGALIRQDRLQRRLGPQRPHYFKGWLAAAAAILIVVGATVIWQLAPGGSSVEPERAMDAAGAVTAESTAPTVPPRVEVDMGGEGVRVYQFAQGEDENTAVYFIVNSALES